MMRVRLSPRAGGLAYPPVTETCWLMLGHVCVDVKHVVVFLQGRRAIVFTVCRREVVLAGDIVQINQVVHDAVTSEMYMSRAD